jgi:hypothetical protein
MKVRVKAIGTPAFPAVAASDFITGRAPVVDGGATNT